MLKLRRLHLWLDEEPRSGPENMAWDEALLDQSTSPVLRYYRWSGDWASVGIRFDLDALPTEIGKHYSVVKRITGGGIVYHDVDATFTVIVPQGDELGSLGTRHVYEWIHGALARNLDATNKQSHRLVGENESVEGDACFQAPVLHDVKDATGAKIAGGAQRRSRTGFMHQGSMITTGVPLHFWQQLAAELAEEVIPWRPDASLASHAGQIAAQRYNQPEWSRLA
jgi:lipoyl(octanoyl) transferase